MNNGSYNRGVVGVAYWHIVAVPIFKTTMSLQPKTCLNKGFVASNPVSKMSIPMAASSRIYPLLAVLSALNVSPDPSSHSTDQQKNLFDACCRAI